MHSSSSISRRGRALVLAATLAIGTTASAGLVVAPAAAHDPDCTTNTEIGSYLACEINRPGHNAQHTVEDEVEETVDGIYWLVFVVVPLLIECATGGPNCA